MKDLRYLSVDIDLDPQRLALIQRILLNLAPTDFEAELLLTYIDERVSTEIREKTDKEIYRVEQSNSTGFHKIAGSPKNYYYTFHPEECSISVPPGTDYQVVKRWFWKGYNIDIDSLPESQRLAKLDESGVFMAINKGLEDVHMQMQPRP